MSIRTCQDQVNLTLVGIKQELEVVSSDYLLTVCSDCVCWRFHVV